MGGIDQSVRASTRKGGVFVTWAAEDGEAQGLPDEVAGAVATAVPEEGKLPFFLDPNTRQAVSNYVCASRFDSFVGEAFQIRQNGPQVLLIFSRQVG